MAVDLNELEALTESIGVMSVSLLNKEHLHSLSVELYHRTMECQVTVELEDNSSAEQRYAMGKLLELERMFAGEVTMSFNIVENRAHANGQSEAASQREYSFA